MKKNIKRNSIHFPLLLTVSIVIRRYKYVVTVIIICLSALPGLGQTAAESADLARRWRASMDAAEQQRIDGIKPNPFITGSHYVDSAYRIGFYFSPGDSISNKSGGGTTQIVISNKFYYMRMSTVNISMAVKNYADKQHDDTKSHTPEGITNYKVGKLKKGENQYCFCYSFRTTYTDKYGKDMIAVIRMQYGTNSSIIKFAATFPDDADAAAKETKLNDFANSVSAW
ncbi:MAG: hypothetical protein ABJA78_02345 [Ferruginibacter sp.]